MCSGGHPSAFLLHSNHSGYSQQRGGAMIPLCLGEQESMTSAQVCSCTTAACYVLEYLFYRGEVDKSQKQNGKK